MFPDGGLFTQNKIGGPICKTGRLSPFNNPHQPGARVAAVAKEQLITLRQGTGLPLRRSISPANPRHLNIMELEGGAAAARAGRPKVDVAIIQHHLSSSKPVSPICMTGFLLKIKTRRTWNIIVAREENKDAENVEGIYAVYQSPESPGGRDYL